MMMMMMMISMIMRMAFLTSLTVGKYCDNIAIYCVRRAAESVAAQQRRCELSKGLVSRARMLYANSESNREPERARASKREPERARESQREPE